MNPYAVWHSVLKPDILNILGLGLVAAAFCWGRSATLRGRMAWLLGPAALVLVLAPLSRAWAWPTLLHPRLEAYIRPNGGFGVFPLFPWVAFVFVGAALGVWIVMNRTPDEDRRFHTRLAGVALAAIGAGFVGMWFPPLLDTSFWTTSWSFFLHPHRRDDTGPLWCLAVLPPTIRRALESDSAVRPDVTVCVLGACRNGIWIFQRTDQKVTHDAAGVDRLRVVHGAAVVDGVVVAQPQRPMDPATHGRANSRARGVGVGWCERHSRAVAPGGVPIAGRHRRDGRDRMCHRCGDDRPPTLGGGTRRGGCAMPADRRGAMCHPRHRTLDVDLAALCRGGMATVQPSARAVVPAWPARSPVTVEWRSWSESGSVVLARRLIDPAAATPLPVADEARLLRMVRVGASPATLIVPPADRPAQDLAIGVPAAVPGGELFLFLDERERQFETLTLRGAGDTCRRCQRGDFYFAARTRPW